MKVASKVTETLEDLSLELLPEVAEGGVEVISNGKELWGEKDAGVWLTTPIG